MQNYQNEKFLELLESAGLIERSDFSALEGYPIPEDIYDTLGLTNISDIKLTEVYAKFRDVPFVQINTIDKKALDIIDKDLAKRSGFIPFFIDQEHKILQVAITNPRKFLVLNQENLKELGKRLGYRIEVLMAAKSQVEKALNAKDFQSVDDLEQLNISPIIFNKIPYDLAFKYQAVPFGEDTQGVLKIASADPGSEQIKDIVTYLKNNGISVELFYANPSQIKSVLNKYVTSEATLEEPDYSQPSFVEEASPNSDLSAELGNGVITLEKIKQFSSSDDSAKLVASIIAFSISKNASDIHIEPFEKSIRVRIRIDGEMEEILSLPQSQLASIVSRIKVFAKLKIEEERIPQDGRFDVTLAGKAIDIRVSTLPTIFGEKVTLRLLPKTHELLELKSLGLDGFGYERLSEAADQPYGLIIATGPTGSGKTTTLYSLLKKLNKPEVDIITIEETIEYELPMVNQVKLQGHLGFGYAEGLKSALKQDPNIIYVGEILDKETAELVIHAALTGRMVLTTMHTNDSFEVLPRLFNLGVDPFLLSSALKAVTAQRLVRRLCPKCKQEIQLNPAILAQIRKELDNLNLNIPYIFYRANGCNECKNGYSGRVGIYEVLKIDNKIEPLVIDRKSDKEILEAAKEQGFITMRQDGFIKALKGLTTIDEVVRATSTMDV